VPGAPGSPGLDPAAQDAEAPAAGGAGHRAGADLGPQALALAVEHDEGGSVEQARHAEAARLAVDPPVEDQRRGAERAVRHGDRDAADDVVRHLVPLEHGEGIGAVLAAERDAHDGLLVLPGRVGGRDVGGVVERGHAVTPRPALADLVDRDVGGLEHEAVQRARLRAGRGGGEPEERESGGAHAGQGRGSRRARGPVPCARR
jgi:hypothetical protein